MTVKYNGPKYLFTRSMLAQQWRARVRDFILEFLGPNLGEETSIRTCHPILSRLMPGHNLEIGQRPLTVQSFPNHYLKSSNFTFDTSSCYIRTNKLITHVLGIQKSTQQFETHTTP